MEKIGVFLSSKTHIAPELAEATLELGRWLGREGKTLVYGGSRAGQMERLAAAVTPLPSGAPVAGLSA